MNKFYVRIINLILIVGILTGYELICSNRETEEKLSKTEYELESVKYEVKSLIAAEAQTEGDTGRYRDGVYNGAGEGFGGDIEVNVSIENGHISDIEILSAENEDKAYLSMAAGIIDEIIESDGGEVDTVSGATYSSAGILEAVSNALSKAE